MRDEARSLFGSFEPRLYSGEEAVSLVEVNSELARMFAAAKLKAAIRVEETRSPRKRRAHRCSYVARRDHR